WYHLCLQVTLDLYTSLIVNGQLPASSTLIDCSKRHQLISATSLYLLDLLASNLAPSELVLIFKEAAQGRLPKYLFPRKFSPFISLSSGHTLYSSLSLHLCSIMLHILPISKLKSKFYPPLTGSRLPTSRLRGKTSKISGG